MIRLAALPVALAVLLAACEAPADPEVINGAIHERALETVWLDRLPETFVLGDWIVEEAVSLAPRDESEKFAPAPRLPGWTGLPLHYAPDLIRMDGEPKPVERPFAATCTRPRYTASFNAWPSSVDDNHRKVHRLFGLPDIPGRRLYGLECNAPPSGDAELSAEEMGGPAYVYPYGEGRIILIWATGEAVLLKRRR